MAGLEEQPILEALGGPHEPEELPGKRENVTQATALFRQYEGFIRHAIGRYRNSHLDDDDVFQEFFLRTVTSPPPANVVSIEGYLFLAVRNCIIDMSRRQVAERRALARYVKIMRVLPDIDPTEELVILDGVWAMRRVLCSADSLVRSLHMREMEVVVRRYRDDSSLPEIAAIMGLKVRTASHYLCTGLQRLRERFAE